MFSCVIDEDLTHHARGDPVEVRAPIPGDVALHEPQVRLVHERGGLECVVRPLTAHVGGGNPSELALDRPDQAIVRLLAVAPVPKETRDVFSGESVGHGGTA